jgi:hypothetical protein
MAVKQGQRRRQLLRRTRLTSPDPNHAGKSVVQKPDLRRGRARRYPAHHNDQVQQLRPGDRTRKHKESLEDQPSRHLRVPVAGRLIQQQLRLTLHKHVPSVELGFPLVHRSVALAILAATRFEEG